MVNVIHEWPEKDGRMYSGYTGRANGVAHAGASNRSLRVVNSVKHTGSLLIELTWRLSRLAYMHCFR